jgi:hypothetical protein
MQMRRDKLAVWTCCCQLLLGYHQKRHVAMLYWRLYLTSSNQLPALLKTCEIWILHTCASSTTDSVNKGMATTGQRNAVVRENQVLVW